MGPVRRGLTLALLPTSALAEVCDKERPNWDGAPVSTFSEALVLFSSIPAVLLLCASVGVFRFRLKKTAVGVVVLWTIFVSFVAMPTAQSMRLASIAEVCVGSPTLFIALVATLCLGIILHTSPTPKQNDV